LILLIVSDCNRSGESVPRQGPISVCGDSGGGYAQSYPQFGATDAESLMNHRLRLMT
jgi:hypothetical protein